MFPISTTTLSEQDLIRKAKAGDKVALNELLKHHKTTLDYKASAFRQAAMPIAAIKGEAYKKFLYAVNHFEPKEGVQFKTYLDNTLRLNRYVNSNKGIARIPEHKVLQITKFKTTKDALEALLGREPTPVEIADHTGQSVTWVSGMERSLKRKALSSSESRESGFSLGEVLGDRWKETKEMVYVQLSPEEQHVFDYSEGAHGKDKMSAVEIAKKLNIKLDRVYTIRKKIDQTFRMYQ